MLNPRSARKKGESFCICSLRDKIKLPYIMPIPKYPLKSAYSKFPKNKFLWCKSQKVKRCNKDSAYLKMVKICHINSAIPNRAQKAPVFPTSNHKYNLSQSQYSLLSYMCHFSTKCRKIVLNLQLIFFSPLLINP